MYVSEQSAAFSFNLSLLALLRSVLCVLNVMLLVMCVRNCLIDIFFVLSEC